MMCVYPRLPVPTHTQAAAAAASSTKDERVDVCSHLGMTMLGKHDQQFWYMGCKIIEFNLFNQMSHEDEKIRYSDHHSYARTNLLPSLTKLERFLDFNRSLELKPKKQV